MRYLDGVLKLSMQFGTRMDEILGQGGEVLGEIMKRGGKDFGEIFGRGGKARDDKYRDESVKF